MSSNMSAAQRKRKLNITPYLFIAPHLILFLIFFLVPFVYGIYASFTKWNLYNDPVFVGLSNYITILTNSESTFYQQFWGGLRNTVTFVLICVPFQIILPLLVATALYVRPKGFRFFQSLFYLPTLISITGVTLAWLFIFNRSMGLYNKLLGTDVNWYGAQPFAWICIVVVTLWWVIGGNMIIYIAALSGVEKELLESSEIDGANAPRRFWHIILPSIRFQLAYTLIMSVIQQFNIYGQPLMLTGGGPNGSTFVLLMYIRNMVFGTGSPIAGMGSAMATLLGLLIGVISIAQLILLRNNE